METKWWAIVSIAIFLLDFQHFKTRAFPVNKRKSLRNYDDSSEIRDEYIEPLIWRNTDNVNRKTHSADDLKSQGWVEAKPIGSRRTDSKLDRNKFGDDFYADQGADSDDVGYRITIPLFNNPSDKSNSYYPNRNEMKNAVGTVDIAYDVEKMLGTDYDSSENNWYEANYYPGANNMEYDNVDNSFTPSISVKVKNKNISKRHYNTAYPAVKKTNEANQVETFFMNPKMHYTDRVFTDEYGNTITDPIEIQRILRYYFLKYDLADPQLASINIEPIKVMTDNYGNIVGVPSRTQTDSENDMKTLGYDRGNNNRRKYNKNQTTKSSRNLAWNEGDIPKKNHKVYFTDEYGEVITDPQRIRKLLKENFIFADSSEIDNDSRPATRSHINDAVTKRYRHTKIFPTINRYQTESNEIQSYASNNDFAQVRYVNDNSKNKIREKPSEYISNRHSEQLDPRDRNVDIVESNSKVTKNGHFITVDKTYNNDRRNHETDFNNFDEEFDSLLESKSKKKKKQVKKTVTEADSSADDDFDSLPPRRNKIRKPVEIYTEDWVSEITNPPTTKSRKSRKTTTTTTSTTTPARQYDEYDEYYDDSGENDYGSDAGHN